LLHLLVDMLNLTSWLEDWRPRKLPSSTTIYRILNYWGTC
jgi:hypothetical protein